MAVVGMTTHLGDCLSRGGLCAAIKKLSMEGETRDVCTISVVKPSAIIIIAII